MNQAVEQRSDEWFAARVGRITGSRVGAILGLNPWQGRSDVMREMVREYVGAEREFTGNVATEHGTKHEPDALAAYEAVTGHIVDEAGLITHPVHDWLAASPDGLVDSDGGVECKCPYSGDLKAIEDQPHYHAQIQLCMAVTGRAWWDYFAWTNNAYHLQRVHFDEDWLPGVMSDLMDFRDEFLATVADEEAIKPHLEPLETDMSDDVTWQALASEYRELDTEIKALKKQQDAAKKALVKMAGDKKARGCGVQVYPTTRQGSVDAAAMAEAAGLNPDDYRKAPTTSWTVRLGKEAA